MKLTNKQLEQLSDEELNLLKKQLENKIKYYENYHTSVYKEKVKRSENKKSDIISIMPDDLFKMNKKQLTFLMTEDHSKNGFNFRNKVFEKVKGLNSGTYNGETHMRNLHLHSHYGDMSDLELGLLEKAYKKIFTVLPNTIVQGRFSSSKNREGIFIYLISSSDNYDQSLFYKNSKYYYYDNDYTDEAKEFKSLKEFMKWWYKHD